MKLGDRVRVLNVPDGSWAGDGRGTIRGYDANRIGFHGGSSAPGEAPRGPAICVILDGPAANKGKEKNEVWLSPVPSLIEILPNDVAPDA